MRELQSVGQYRSGGVSGLLLTSEVGRQTLVVPTDHSPTMPVNFVLVCPRPERVLDGLKCHFFDSRVRWTKPAPQLVPPIDFAWIQQASDEARASCQDQFAYREEQSTPLAPRSAPKKRPHSAKQLGIEGVAETAGTFGSHRKEP